MTHARISREGSQTDPMRHVQAGSGSLGVPSSLTAHHAPRLALTQVCAVVLELLGEFLQVGLSQRNDLPASGLLQHSSIPVVGTHGTQQNPVLALERGHTSTRVP